MNQQYNRVVGFGQTTTQHKFAVGQHESPKSVIISCEKIVLRDSVIEVDVDITNGIEKLNKIVINGIPFYRIHDPDVEPKISDNEELNSKLTIPQAEVETHVTNVDTDDDIQQLTIFGGENDSVRDTYVVANGD